MRRTNVLFHDWWVAENFDLELSLRFTFCVSRKCHFVVKGNKAIVDAAGRIAIALNRPKRELIKRENHSKPR